MQIVNNETSMSYCASMREKALASGIPSRNSTFCLAYLDIEGSYMDGEWAYSTYLDSKTDVSNLYSPKWMSRTPHWMHFDVNLQTRPLKSCRSSITYNPRKHPLRREATFSNPDKVDHHPDRRDHHTHQANLDNFSHKSPYKADLRLAYYSCHKQAFRSTRAVPCDPSSGRNVTPSDSNLFRCSPGPPKRKPGARLPSAKTTRWHGTIPS